MYYVFVRLVNSFFCKLSISLRLLVWINAERKNEQTYEVNGKTKWPAHDVPVEHGIKSPGLLRLTKKTIIPPLGGMKINVSMIIGR